VGLKEGAGSGACGTEQRWQGLRHCSAVAHGDVTILWCDYRTKAAGGSAPLPQYPFSIYSHISNSLKFEIVK
jgi:hypothetical protein